MRADTGPIGGDLSHEFIILAETGESAVFCHDATWSTRTILEPRHRLRRRPAADRRRVDVALRRDRREARPGSLRRRCPRPSGWLGARHRGRPHLLFRHQVFEADEGASWPARTASRSPVEMGSYGIGVSRLVGAHHRGEPRRGRHHLAGARGAVQGRRSSTCKPGRRRGRRAPAEKLYAALHGAGRRGAATTTATSGRARKFADHGPDRPALAGHRRPARRGGRQGRAEAPRAPASARSCRRSTWSRSASADRDGLRPPSSA